MTTDTVLVTGGTGFLGVHVIAQLIECGYSVRTTVRDPQREDEVRSGLKRADIAEDRVEFFTANLSEDTGWPSAIHGARYVLHVASPFPPAMPKDENDVILPARDGALRVLRAARDDGVERVVMTSSFAAVGYGHAAREQEFTEHDWTNIDAPLSAYIRSKAVAERAAWEFVEREGGSLELTTINPVGIFGPPLTPDLSASIGLARQMLTAMQAVPRLATTVVDVRDVADLHIRAMTAPQAAGQRFLASTGEPLTFQDVARILRKAVGAINAELPILSDEAVLEAAKMDPGMAGMVGELGKRRRVSSAKARALLNWTPRTNAEALEATAQALRELGLLPL
ncbi:aldehyde reductase [Burkholderia gladioli]|uniref:SDR family oxidoreductase n=1 Tax=Burkholderia gladioli TaxID=28095 RepID=UPI002FE1A8CA